MDNIVPEYYREYGLYVNKSKMFPSVYDGLLPVQRRIILGALSVAKGSFVKTSKVLGETMSKWHPHAEQVGTVEWLVQNGFLDGSGWWGSRYGSTPSKCAAPRYTSVKASKKLLEMTKYIDYVEWEPQELEPEPVSIPTLLPFCLVSRFRQEYIGFGYKTSIPVFSPSDLVDRILHKKLIRPTFKGLECISEDYECEELLSSGKSKLTFKPVFKVSNKELLVQACAEVPFQKYIKSLGQLWENKQVGYLETSINNEVYFIFKPLRNTSVEQIVDLIDKMKIVLSFDIKCYDYKSDSFRTYSVDEMLAINRDFYRQAFRNYLNTEISKLNNQIKEREIINKILPYLEKVSILKSNQIEKLSELSGIPKEEIQPVIEKYRIKAIIDQKSDISSLKQKLSDTKKILSNIDLYVEQDYLHLVRCFNE